MPLHLLAPLAAAFLAPLVLLVLLAPLVPAVLAPLARLAPLVPLALPVLPARLVLLAPVVRLVRVSLAGAGGPSGPSRLIAGAATHRAPVRYPPRHEVMSEDREQAQVIASRLLASDRGCLRGSTLRDPNTIWERAEPLFCE